MINFFKKKVVLDKLLLIFTLCMFGFFRPDYVLITAYIFMIPYLFITKRQNILKHFLLATVISAIWVLFTQHLYVYNHNFINIGGINLYPFFGWSVGLTAAYLIFEHYRNKFENRNLLNQIWLFILIYWILLLFGETVAYHVFDVKNILTAVGNLPLPICECMHIPNWMKFAYFALGPLFFGASYLLGWEKESKTKDHQRKPKAF